MEKKAMEEMPEGIKKKKSNMEKTGKKKKNKIPCRINEVMC